MSKWAAVNDLRLGLGKTKAILFSSCKYVNTLKRIGLPSIHMGDGNFVSIFVTVKSLNVILAFKLMSKSQIYKM